MKLAIDMRFRALRRAARTFWWMVVRPQDPTLSRGTWLGIAARQLRCGLLTGGTHSWGPLAYAYEGARLRKQTCRWCNASMTPASEFERHPLTEDEERHARAMIGKPTEQDAERALGALRERGLYRDGKFLWD